MPFRRASALLLAFLLLPLQTAQSGQAENAGDRIENLRAFAKLYGYVRFFHPSDEAAQTDWERFAILGAARVAGISRDELRPTLESLFLPIAPSVQIVPRGVTAQTTQLTPEPDETLPTVAWQHKGVGLGNPGPYLSIRINRKNPVPGQAQFGTLTQSIDAAPHRGKEIRLSARVRAEVDGAGNQAQVWLRVDRAQGDPAFFDNMSDRPIRNPEWKPYEISATVSGDATRIVFGVFLLGRGAAWVDDVRLVVREPGGAWSPVSIENAGFESGESGEAPPGWGSNAPSYRFVTVRENPAEGEQAAKISDAPAIRETPLFDQHPQVGEIVTAPLGGGLVAHVPLALFSRDGRTLPRPEAARLEALRDELRQIDLVTSTAVDASTRFAAVIIAWNVFQHFYPYFDVIDTDWDAALTQALHRAEKDRTVSDFHETLRRLVARLHDGHGGVHHPQIAAGRALLPFLTEWVEGKAVVVATSEDSPVERGDVVVAIDGVPAHRIVERDEALFSGSPQWRRTMALRQMGGGAKDSVARVTVERQGKVLQLSVGRNASSPAVEPRPASFTALKPGVLYVNLSEAEMPQIQARLGELASSRAVVFDLRGYPKGNHDVLRHLTGEPLRSAQWQIPQIIYPDRKDLVGYDPGGRWLLEPREPRLTGRIVFLTDASAISYAESVMGIVEHYGLGTIVGEATAGTNGNINSFSLPGGFRVGWTGMRVIKHDGSQHHLIGIVPSVAAKRTVAGIRAGRDEFLETALEIATRTEPSRSREAP